MRSAFDLSGQRILIPGAAGGIGGVPVNGIVPGPIDTEMTLRQAIDLSGIPLGRVAGADEIVWPVAFLCSPAAGYGTGTVLDLNGGLYMH
jgi:NAD(P)-dependent dehydrogenase (short-subunit alcohol dehydrogenase family)